MPGFVDWCAEKTKYMYYMMRNNAVKLPDEITQTIKASFRV